MVGAILFIVTASRSLVDLTFTNPDQAQLVAAPINSNCNINVRKSMSDCLLIINCDDDNDFTHYLSLAISHLISFTCSLYLAICYLLSVAFYRKFAITCKNLFPFAHCSTSRNFFFKFPGSYSNLNVRKSMQIRNVPKSG